MDSSSAQGARYLLSKSAQGIWRLRFRLNVSVIKRMEQPKTERNGTRPVAINVPDVVYKSQLVFDSMATTLSGIAFHCRTTKKAYESVIIVSVKRQKKPYWRKSRYCIGLQFEQCIRLPSTQMYLWISMNRVRNSTRIPIESIVTMGPFCECVAPMPITFNASNKEEIDRDTTILSKG